MLFARIAVSAAACLLSLVVLVVPSAHSTESPTPSPSPTASSAPVAGEPAWSAEAVQAVGLASALLTFLGAALFVRSFARGRLA
jgi:hypothetical protein